MKAANYSPHIFSLFALFVCGNAIITQPFGASNSIFCFVIYAAAAILVYVLCMALAKWFFKNKLVFYGALMVFIPLAIYGAATTLYDYLLFITKIQLPQTNVILVATAMLFAIVAFVASPNSSLYKYCLLSGIISAIMIAIVFLSAIKHFDFSQLVTNFNKTDFSIDSSKILFRYFSMLPIPIIFAILTTKTFPLKASALGLVAGFVTLFICWGQSVLILGAANNIPYAYMRAVGIISTGSLFTRLDGLVYFVYFVSAITKATICIKTIFLIIKIRPKKAGGFLCKY